MIRRPPRATRTDTLFPYTTRFRSAEADIERLEAELKILLLPKDPNDGKNVIVEVRGAEGGEEANLFARDLFEMYQAYAGRMGWKLEVLGSDPSDMGGFNDITFMLKGEEIGRAHV